MREVLREELLLKSLETGTEWCMRFLVRRGEGNYALRAEKGILLLAGTDFLTQYRSSACVPLQPMLTSRKGQNVMLLRGCVGVWREQP